MKNNDLPTHIQFARGLRKNQTQEEKLLWNVLRNRKLLGLKFVRQYPILVPSGFESNFFYIADFYCAEKKLLLEIDGPYHTNQIEYDNAIDQIMHEMKINVIRFTIKELNNNLQMVLNIIIEFVSNIK
jgi:very-short-patch-repair endonuclease